MKSDEQPLSDEICVVCGKDTSGGRGFMTLHLEGRFIALCCPQCQKVYQETPALFTQQRRNRDTVRDIEHGLGFHDTE